MSERAYGNAGCGVEEPAEESGQGRRTVREGSERTHWLIP